MPAPTPLFTDHFHPDFQELVLGLMARDQDFLAQARGIIRAHYFAAAVYKAICEALYALWDEQGQLPSPVVLAQATSKGVPDQTTRELYVDKVKALYELSADDLNREFIQAEVLSFAQRAEFAFAIYEANENLRSASIAGTYEQLERILALPSRFGRLGLDLHNDWSVLLEKDYTPRFHSGFQGLDAGMRGGARPGELVVILAKMKAGKSQILANIAVGLMLAGYVAVLYSLEMYEEDQLARTVASLTGLPTNHLAEYSEDVHARVLGSKHFTTGRLIVKEFPGRQTSVMDIQTHLELVRARLGKIDGVPRPVVPVIDYMDLVIPNVRYQDETKETMEVYTLIRNMGRKLGVPVYSATQGNRESLLADEINEGHQQFYRRGMVCDYMLGFAQSKVDKAARRFRLLWILGRHASGQPLYFKERWDTSRAIEITAEEFEKLNPGVMLKGSNDLEAPII
jgi:hypothetical protein